MKQLLLVTILMIVLSQSNAQNNLTWNHKSCAVVLTYDDGLDIDFSHVIPALDSVNLKGTFYISDYFDGLHAQISKWRKAAANGHELANHTIWHPCEGGRKGREFVQTETDLNNYTVSRIQKEIKSMNNLLYAIDGRSKRTFAYPCGDTRIHDTAYLDQLKNDFIAARGVNPELLPIEKIDLFNMGSYTVNGQTGNQLIALVKQAAANHTLLVFLFHGVGGGHGLNVSQEAHTQLLHYLKQNEPTIWVAPLLEVGAFVKKYQDAHH